MAKNEWFVYQNGTPPSGPVSSESLLRQHGESKLGSKTLLCPAEGGEWKPVAELLPLLQARTETSAPPWFIFREGQPPLGPLTDTLLQRGIEAGRVPPDALLSRAGGLAWYSQARALAEPAIAPAADPPDEETRHEKTAMRPAVVAPASDAQLARERMILAAFCAAPLLLGALLALFAR